MGEHKDALAEALAQIGGDDGLAKLIEKKKAQLADAAGKLESGGEWDVLRVTEGIDVLVSLLTLKRRFDNADLERERIALSLDATALELNQATLAARERWAWRYYASAAATMRLPRDAAELADQLLKLEVERYGAFGRDSDDCGPEAATAPEAAVESQKQREDS